MTDFVQTGTGVMVTENILTVLSQLSSLQAVRVVSLCDL